MHACLYAQSLSCVRLCDPRDLPGSSVHRLLQARILEWFASIQGIFPTQESNLFPLNA